MMLYRFDPMSDGRAIVGTVEGRMGRNEAVPPESQHAGKSNEQDQNLPAVRNRHADAAVK